MGCAGSYFFSFFLIGTALLLEDMHANPNKDGRKAFVSDAADENLAEEAEEFNYNNRTSGRTKR